MKSFLPAAVLLAALGAYSGSLSAAEPSLTRDIWPGTPPGETKTLPPEADQTKAADKLIAGRRIIKLGNVSTPQIAVYRPAKNKDSGTSVIICPGGGFNILAYDLEGTEVAEWLNSVGVTGIVLKYRVPARNPQKRWLAAVQDAQRTLSLVRSQAGEWGLDPSRIGILGFSAGGATAAFAGMLSEQRQYTAADAVDRVSCRPDFALVIYPGALVERDRTTLNPEVVVPRDPPPMFLVQTFDDPVSVHNTLLFAGELKKAGGSAEVHVYDVGGHGYGLRYVAELPVTTWPKRAEEWFARRGLLDPSVRRGS